MAAQDSSRRDLDEGFAGVWREVLPSLSRQQLGDLKLAGSTGSQIARLFSFARPYRGRLACGLAAVVAGSLVALAAPLTWRYLVDAVVPGGNPENLSKITLILIGLYILGGVIGVLSGYLLRLVGLRVTMDLRLRLYEHLQSLSLSFFGHKRTGELVSRLMNDVASIRQIVTGDLSGLLRQVVVFFGALVLILITDWRLTGLMFLMVPVVAVISTLFGRAVRRLSREVTDGIASVTTVLEESLSGVRTVRSFVRERYEIERFRGRLVRLLRLGLRRMYLEILFGPLLSVLFFSSTVVIIWFGGQQVLAGRLTTGQLVTFIILSTTIGGSIRWLGGLWTRLQAALGASQRLFELLDSKTDIAELPDAVSLPALKGSLSFERVSFTYPSAESDIVRPRALDGISIDIQAGETLAIVGPSGAGKTTLVNLVPRFYDPTEGRLLVDGIDVRSATLRSLREQIGIVPQDTHLFGGTVRENLLYGKLDASEEELVEAARAANAHGFIVELPRGYDTEVGERGTKLSGGQRQRLTIARALLKAPRILLLDEATSSLDNESEQLVQEALERLMAGRTTLVIAHRMSTIKNADRIAVVNSGRLVELGTHAELLASEGLYARLYRHQFRDLEEPFPELEAARSTG